MSFRWREALRDALTLRLALWYFALFTLSSVVLVALTYVLLARSLQAQDREIVAAMLERYASQYATGGLAALDQSITNDRLEGRHEQLFVRVVGRQATATYFTMPAGWRQFDLAALDLSSPEPQWWQTLRGQADGITLEVATVRLAGNTLVQVGRSSQLRDSLLARFRERTTTVLTIILLMAMAGGVVLTSMGLAPARRMEATLRSIVHTGRIDARVEVRGGGDVLSELGVLVNLMLDRIERLVSGMRGALDNVAHDLRTPLTRLRNVTEEALAAPDREATRDGLARVVEETDRLGATLTTLMDISGAETGTLPLRRASIPLAGVVGEATALYDDVAEAKGVSLVVAEIDPGIVFEADGVRVRQVVANLLDNAVKYTPPGGRVEVRGVREGAHVSISVADTGIGIEAADLPRVWDRLFRADSSRAERGFGLGLSLVKAIVESHGGTVAVSSTPGRGSVFTIIMPVASPNLSPM